jgi:hypothetical protein
MALKVWPQCQARLTTDQAGSVVDPKLLFLEPDLALISNLDSNPACVKITGFSIFILNDRINFVRKTYGNYLNLNTYLMLSSG